MHRVHNVGSALVDHSHTPLPPPGAAREDLWRRVQRAYATGKERDEELAARFAHEGVTAKRLRAKRASDRARDPGSWPQNIQGDVTVATRAILAQQAVLEEGGKADAVMAAARQVAGVLTRHRADAGEARDAVMEIVAELRRAATNSEQWAKILAVCEQELTSEERAALRQQFRHALAMHSRAGSVHKAADALIKVQLAERKAWGVAEDPRDANPLDALNDQQLQAEIDRLDQEIGKLMAASGGVVVPLHGLKA